MINTQQVFATKTLDVSNLKNGYIEVQVTWPKPFADLKGEPGPGYFLLPSFISPSSNKSAKNALLYAGLRDVSSTGFILVVSLNGAFVGDVVEVYGLGWQ